MIFIVLLEIRDPIFFMETRGGTRLLNMIKLKLAFQCVFIVNSLRSKGELAMMWNLESKTEVLHYSNSNIHMKVEKWNTGSSWSLIGFYGNLDLHRKKESWSLLSRSNKGDGEPQYFIGDFNEILYQNEKEGGRLRPSIQMVVSRTTLQDNNLFDIGQRGPKFIWCNRHQDESFTKERLDHVVANEIWQENLGTHGVKALNSTRSDHLPLLLITKEKSGFMLKQKYLFRFEAK